jgi:hypothetical protein
MLGAAAAALALAPAAAHAATPAPKSPTTFAVIGDTPYGTAAFNALPGQINQINNDPDVRLVMHLGDIKSGSTRCDTSYFEAIKSKFDLFEDPLVYTPGDNEWTDCHRANNGGYQPAGKTVTSALAPNGPVQNGAPVGQPGANVPSRLSEIRRIFFGQRDRTLGQHARHVLSQGPNYPENVRFNQGTRGVTVGSLHIVGSNNGLLPWFDAAETPALAKVRQTEVARRNAANLRWLDRIFASAEANDSRAVLLGLQADMWDPFIVTNPLAYSGFTEFVQKLAAKSIAFGKPVLLINGDSHLYEADQPLADHTAVNSTIYGVTQDVPNLTRVTVNGSNNATEYLRLKIDLASPGVFSWARVPLVS